MPNILLVDDEKENINALKRHIEDNKADWKLFVAKCEAEAEIVLIKNEIDVVITDLKMDTDHSGLKILQLAKKKNPLTAVILVTAYEKLLNRYEAYELGAFDCVAKNTPGIYAVEELLVKATAALASKTLMINYLENDKRLEFLKRYFDPQIFSLIENNPDMLNIHNKLLTICFWDIRGFSKLCESLKGKPFLISEFLKDYFKTASEVIFAHHGVLDKFIGDGIMALFGVISESDDEAKGDAINAVSAALALRVTFDKLLKKWIEKWQLSNIPDKITIGLGCGIHTGEALLGNVGTEIRDQFTALGPHINFAQRIESNAKEMQILISSTTKVRIHDVFDVKRKCTLKKIKNISGEYDIFEVIASKILLAPTLDTSSSK